MKNFQKEKFDKQDIVDDACCDFDNDSIGENRINGGWVTWRSGKIWGLYVPNGYRSSK